MFDAKWNTLISEFQRLGGIAENVYQKKNINGRGIFSIDPTSKSRIYIPSNLMVQKEDIFINDNKLRIKSNTNYSSDISSFFSFYQDNFSWGCGGREVTYDFELGLDLFNSNLKANIKKCFSVDINKRHSGDWNEIVLEQFLSARCFQYENKSVICPVLELVNHNPISLPILFKKEGISTPNYRANKSEFCHYYGNASPSKRFFVYGFFSKEPIIFSMPFSIDLLDSKIKFECKGLDLTDDSIKIFRDNNTISIEGLPIADANTPSLPQNYFNEYSKRIGKPYFLNEIFFKIIDYNILKRQIILEELLSIEHEVSKLLIRMIRYEINLIKSCNLNHTNQG